jgi:hypothetical protein
MDLKPGSRWKSAVCDVEVVIVRPPSAPGTLECGGQPMVGHTAEKPAGLSLSPDRSGGSQTGKRFTDETTGLEVLCTKAGAGSLSLDGRPLELKEAKKLPASD